MRKCIAAVLAGIVLVATGCSPSGGATTTRNDKLGVAVKANASDVRITKHAGKLPTGMARPVGDVVDVSAKELKGEAELSFDIPKGVNPKSAMVYTYDAKLKRAIPVGGRLSKDSKSVSVTTTHFSPWWLTDYEYDLLTGRLDPRVAAQSQLLKDFVSEFAGVAQADDCKVYAITVELSGTLPDDVKACAKYVGGKLQLELANSFGAPLAVTMSPGLKVLKVTPENETVFTSLAQTVRAASGDDTLVLSTGQTAVIEITDARFKQGAAQLSARVDMGTAMLDFSGAILEALLPGIKKDAYTAGEWAIKTSKQVSCLFREGQKLDAMRAGASRSQMQAEFFKALDRCHADIVRTVEEILKDPAGPAKHYGKAVLNQLPQHIARRITVLIQLLANGGKLVRQPVAAAISKLRGDGTFVLRMKFDPNPTTRLKEVLPLKFKDESQAVRKQGQIVLHAPLPPDSPEPVNFPGWEPLDGDTCTYVPDQPNTWNQGEADATRSAVGIYQFDVGGRKLVRLMMTVHSLTPGFSRTIQQQIEDIGKLPETATRPECQVFRHFKVGTLKKPVALKAIRGADTHHVIYFHQGKYVTTVRVFGGTNDPATEKQIAALYAHWAERLAGMVNIQVR